MRRCRSLVRERHGLVRGQVVEVLVHKRRIVERGICILGFMPTTLVHSSTGILLRDAAHVVLDACHDRVLELGWWHLRMPLYRAGVQRLGREASLFGLRIRFLSHT